MTSPFPIRRQATLITKIENLIPAGFPVPHTDSSNSRIDLNDTLLLNPNASYLFRVRGNSMTGAGIFDGDTVIVDRSIEPRHGYIVLAVVDQEYTVKRLFRRGQTIRLLPENPDYAPIELAEGSELEVWGVVTFNLRKLL